VSVQNGVDNEREALRQFTNVYSVCVMCPTGHLEPGVVMAYSSPISGILDVGCYPSGIDGVAEGMAAAFRASAVCGPTARAGPLGELVIREGEACLRAAGIAFVTTEEDAARRDDLLQIRPIGANARPGGSSWQSLQRATGSIETDYLNGEIVLLGRMHRVPTPVNELLQRLANEAARDRAAPGSIAPEEILTRAGSAMA